MPPTTTRANGRCVSLPTPDEQCHRQQADEGEQRGHKHRSQPLGGAFDQRRPQRLAVAPPRFRGTQHQHSHERHLTQERDESHRGAYRQRHAGRKQCKDASGKGERHRQQNGKCAAPRIHGPVQQAEHDQNCHRNDELEPGHGALLVFEFAAPDEVIALGRRHASPDGVDGILDHRTHVASLDVELQGEETAVSFPVYRRHAVGDLDVGQITQGDAGAGLGGDRDGADPFGVVADVQRQHQAYRHRALPLPQCAQHAPGQRSFQGVLRVFHRNAGARERLAGEAHLQLGRRRVPVEVQIDDARHRLERVPGLFQGAAHSRQVGAEYLQHHLAAHAADRFLDVVLDRLREVVTHAGDLVHRSAHFLHQALFIPARAPFAQRFQANEGFTHVDAFVVGAVLGTALLAQGSPDLGESEYPPAHVEQNLLSLCQCDAGRHLDEHDDVAFVQLRAETRCRDG